MQNSHSNMESTFRDILENHEVDVNPLIWDALEDELFDSNTGVSKWYKYFSYAAIFLISIGLTVAASQQYFNYTRLSQQTEIDPDSHLLKYYSHTSKNVLAQTITKEVEVIKKVYETVEVPVEVRKYASTSEVRELKNLLTQFRNSVPSKEDMARLDAKLHLIQKYKYNNSSIETNANDAVDGLTSIDLEELLAYGISENLKTELADDETFIAETNNLGMALDGSGTFGHHTETSTQQLIDNILKDKVTDIEGIQVGGGTTFFNSWILNKSISKVSPNMLHYPLTWGMQYDFTLGYNINSKISNVTPSCSLASSSSLKGEKGLL